VGHRGGRPCPCPQCLTNSATDVSSSAPEEDPMLKLSGSEELGILSRGRRK